MARKKVRHSNWNEAKIHAEERGRHHRSRRRSPFTIHGIRSPIRGIRSPVRGRRQSRLRGRRGRLFPGSNLLKPRLLRVSLLSKLLKRKKQQQQTQAQAPASQSSTFRPAPTSPRSTRRAAHKRVSTVRKARSVTQRKGRLLRIRLYNVYATPATGRLTNVFKYTIRRRRKHADYLENVLVDSAGRHLNAFLTPGVHNAYVRARRKVEVHKARRRIRSRFARGLVL
jgi:hypothetical protein